MMRQLSAMPRYKADGKLYTTIHEAAKALGKVTAVAEHKLERRPGVNSKDHEHKDALYKARAEELAGLSFERNTLFKEIVAVPQEPHPDILALYNQPSGTDSIEPKRLARLAIDAFLEHVGEYWKPGEHVMMFSSGYDTRLQAALLKRLALEKGDAWLGKVHCYTFQPEVAYARRIFEYLDLPAGFTFEPVDENRDPIDYYRDCLQLDTVGANLSDTERFWGGPLLVQLRKLGAIKQAQGLSAIFSDETSKWNRMEWGTVGWFMGCYLFDQPGLFPGRPDVEFVLPYGSHGWLELMTRYKMPCPIDTFKLTMLGEVDKTLADTAALPNFRFEVGPMRKRNGGYVDQQKLSRETTEAMESWYAGTWYAEQFKPHKLDFSDNVFRYLDQRTRHYIAAAICEHLIANGVEVVR